MVEIKYVTRCFLFAIIILMLLQIKIKNQTLEARGTRWLHESRIGDYLSHVSEGGALFLRNGYEQAQEFYQQSVEKSPNNIKASLSGNPK